LLLNIQFNFAQQQNKLDTIVSTYIYDLTKVWDDNRSLTFNELIQTESSGVDVFTSIASDKTNVTSTIKEQQDLVIRRNKLQQTIYRKDVGLSLGGGYQENLSAPFINLDDDVVFRRKFMIGLDWDILKGGLIGNKTKIKSLQNDLLFMELSQQKSTDNSPSTLAFYTKVISSFNKAKLKVLEQRLSLINKQNAIARNLWELKQISGDTYLKSIQHKTDIIMQHKLYSTYNLDAKAIKDNEDIELKPILFELNFAKVLRYLDSTEVVRQPSSEKEDYKGNLNAYYKEMSLRAYTRYNYYDLFNNTSNNRSFVSVGLNFSAPLTLNAKEKNEIDQINYQLRTYQKDQSLNVANGNNTEYYLLNLFYEYRYKLKQYFNLLEKRKVLEELLRTEMVKQKLSDLEFNPITAIYTLDDHWANTIDLLDLHQQMYGALLNIHEKVPGLKFSDFITPISVNDYASDLEIKTDKCIYIWSKSFTNHSVEFVSDYIKLNAFTDAMVSYRSDKKYIKDLNAFVLSNRKLKTHLMIGQNKLLFSGISSTLDSLKSNIDLGSITGLHLDIEPQAMDGFKDNKEDFFAKYLSLLDETSQFCVTNKLKLSVSIPLNYPDNVLIKIFEKCDKVFLMAYENVNEDFIKRKMEEELKIDASKVVLALRSKDFATKDVMDKLFLKLGIKNVAYHDLESLFELDKQSIRVKQELEKTGGDKSGNESKK